jgi:hypothetical protein
MKKVMMLLVSAVFILLTVSTVHAKNNPAALNLLENKSEDILLQEVSSGDIELKASSVLSLGELQSQKAVIPLLKILKSDNDERARLSAALSLYKIGDSRGIYAIKKAIRFDESKRVQRLCSILYAVYENDNA